MAADHRIESGSGERWNSSESPEHVAAGLVLLSALDLKRIFVASFVRDFCLPGAGGYLLLGIQNGSCSVSGAWVCA